MLNRLLDGGILPDWITTSFPIIRMVLMIVIVLCAVAIIISILAMESNPEGGRNVISGTNDSFYAQNQGSTKEGRLKRIVIVASIILIVAAIAVCVTLKIFQG